MTTQLSSHNRGGATAIIITIIVILIILVIIGVVMNRSSEPEIDDTMMSDKIDNELNTANENDSDRSNTNTQTDTEDRNTNTNIDDNNNDSVSNTDNGSSNNDSSGTDDPEVTTPPVSTGGGSNGNNNGETNTEPTGVTTVDITARSYAFAESEIRVNRGDRVRIVLSIEGGTHDFVVDELGLRTQRAQTGETTSIEFIADTAGTFTFYCSVGNHRALGMEGTLVIE